MATSQDIINYYADLLIKEYVGQPNAYATIQAMVTPVIMDLVALDVQGGFEITSAQGVQLDILGKYVGVTRSGYGFQGQQITLNDPDFIQLIQLAVLTNNSDASLYTIDNLLAQYFPGAVLVFDFSNMHMSYFINSSLGTQNLVEMFVVQGLLPKPMGVQLASVIYSPNVNSFFGCVTYELPRAVNNSPCNTYESYQTNRPMLVYEDSIQT